MINLFLFNIFTVFCDIPEHYQFTIQDPATENLEWMIDLYDLICFELIVIVSVIFILLFSLFYSPTHHDLVNKYSKKSFSHSTELEVFWTIVPAILLLTIAYPSFNLLYALDEDHDYTEFVIKIIGHQWYWTYEFHIGWKDIQFDSYMVDQKDLNRFIPGLSYTYNDKYKFTRLLEVDNRLIIPAKSYIKLLITSADVLHSWTVPSFGIKVDACPGRLTKANLVIKRPGIYFGQCSEICGINHGFMPITIQALPPRMGYTFAKYANYDLVLDKDINFQKDDFIFCRDTLQDVLDYHEYQKILGFISNYGFDEKNDDPYVIYDTRTNTFIKDASTSFITNKKFNYDELDINSIRAFYKDKYTEERYLEIEQDILKNRELQHLKQYLKKLQGKEDIEQPPVINKDREKRISEIEQELLKKYELDLKKKSQEELDSYQLEFQQFELNTNSEKKN